jgi:hypothetical protein
MKLGIIQEDEESKGLISEDQSAIEPFSP